MHARFGQYFLEIGQLISIRLKRRAVAVIPIVQTRLANNALHQLPNCHTRWDRMGIDNNIWTDSVLRKWHILFRNNHSNGSLLPGTRRHFVTNCRNTFFSNLHLCNSGSFFAVGNKCLMNNSELSFLCRF